MFHVFHNPDSFAFLRVYIGMDQVPEWVERTKARLIEAEHHPVADDEALALCRMWGRDAVAA
jgi:hypothetical protein